MTNHMTMRLLTVLAFMPAIVTAQSGLPGTNISATIRVRSVAIVGDTTTVKLSILVGPTSKEDFFWFFIPSSAPGLTIPVPAPYWVALNVSEGIPGAMWASGPRIGKNDSTPTLTFRAIGVPGTAIAYLHGDSDIIAPSNVYLPGYDPLNDLSLKVATIGINVAPSGGTALAARVQSQSDTACTLGWITSAPLCTTLHTYSGSADYATIAQFTASLDSARSHGSAVSDAGYFLLKPNATYVLAHLPPPPLAVYITVDTTTSLFTAHTSGGAPSYSYLWEWCVTSCGAALRAPAPPPVAGGIHPNTSGSGWHDVGYYTASICWTMSQSTLRLTVTDAARTQVVTSIAVPLLEHVCSGP